MFLLEKQIDGLLRRKIGFSSMTDHQSGSRSLDYSGILNEKQNQIVELEKKINNLEEKLRRASIREKDLENEILRLNSVIKGIQNPNVSKTDIDRLLISTLDMINKEKEMASLRNQLTGLNGLITKQFEMLK